MDYDVRVCGIEPESIVDGEGIRYVLFIQGCPHHCTGCHNPQTHPFDGGKVVNIRDLYDEICKNPLLSGVTFSGGEPFCQPEPLAALAGMVHRKGLNVITYTGYLYEELLGMENRSIEALLEQTDILIDGPFILEQRNLTLRFRGSGNQRVIDMNKTRQCGKITFS